MCVDFFLNLLKQCVELDGNEFAFLIDNFQTNCGSSNSLLERDCRVLAPIRAQAQIKTLLGLIRNLDNMSFGDQKRFWIQMNGLSRCKIVQEFDINLRKVYYNGNRNEFQILYKNYKIHSKQLDTHKRDIIEIIFKKYLEKVRAQALINLGLDFSHLDKMCSNGSLSHLVKEMNVSHNINFPIVDKLSNLLDGISSSSLRKNVILFALFIIKSKFGTVEIYDVIILLTAIGVLDYLTCSVVDLARYVLNSFQRTDDCVKAQSSTDNIYVENIFLTITHFVKSLIFPDINKVSDFNVRSKKIFEIWRTVKSVDEMIRALIKFFEIAQDKVVKYLCGYSMRDRQLFAVLPGLEKWYNDVNEIYLAEGNFSVTISPDQANLAKNLYAKGLDFLKTLRALRCPQEVLSVFHNTLGMSKELFLHAQSLNCTSKTRVPPLVVHFYGGAGVGKSTLCQYVIGDVAKEAGFKEYSNDLIYVRDVQQEFWDGYCGQFATIYDDIFQSDDSLKRGLEAVELVRANNTMQMPLHMADISQKGNMCFSSKLILLTSNPPRERCIGISTNEAFWRRRDFVFKVVPNEKYCRVIEIGSIKKVRVDPVKVKEMCGKKYTTDIYNFDMEDVETGEVLMSGLNYEEMINLVRFGYTDKYKVSCDLIAEVEERFYAQGLSNLFRAPYGLHADMETFHDALSYARHFTVMKGESLFNWCAKLTKLDEQYPILKWLPILTTTISLAISLWSMVGTSTPKAEYNISGDSVTKRKSVAHVIVKGEYNISGDSQTKKRVANNWRIKGEGCIDPNALSLVNNKLWKNCVKITLCGNNGEIIMRGIFLKGKVLIAPAHLLKYNEENTFFHIESVYGNFRDIPFELVKLYINDDIDLCGILFPKYVVDFPDISKHFISSSDIKNISIFQALLYKYEGNTASRGTIHRINRINKIGKQNYELDTVKGSINCTILQGLKYETFTEPGMCGSPIVAMNPACPRKILGFHVAGATHNGYSNILTSSIIDTLLSNFDEQLTIEELDVLEESESNSRLLAEGNVNIIGRIPKNQRIFYPNKSKIVPSIIQGKMSNIVTKPAVLSRSGLIDPMVLGIKKYFDDPIMLDPEILEFCGDSVYKDIKVCLEVEHRRRVLSTYEAMNGIDGDKFITSINWNTSVGFPYIHIPSTNTGKYKMIVEVAKDKYMPNEKLSEDLAIRYAKAKIGVVTPTIWVDNLKDERRPMAKVDNFKTRVFVTGPFDFTILFRQFCLGFTAHVMDCRDKLECKVGINPHSYEWTELYNTLDEIGLSDTWIAGDFTAYDGVLPLQVIDSICDVVNNWYDDGSENALVRRVLFSSIYSAYHICDDLIYRTNHGNPSGNPFTAVMNSLANSVLMRYIFIVLGRKFDCDLSNYKKYVRAANYGDDNLLHISEMCPWFNMQTISDEFITLGIKYTPATKNNIYTNYINTKEITFLKRKFVWNGKVCGFLAPLDWNSIMEMFNWIRLGQDPTDALLANVRSALYELYHYGPDVYKDCKKKLDKILLGERIRPFDDTWCYYYGLWSRGVEDVNCGQSPYFM